MGTVLEGDLEEVLEAFKEAHKEVLRDSKRVLSTLKIDERTDKENTIEMKLRTVEEL